MGPADHPVRRSIRLRGFDYSMPGGYFVTICARSGTHPFAMIVKGKLRATSLGAQALAVWKSTPEHFPLVVLDAHCLMPNHFHGIVWIYDGPSVMRPRLGVIIRAFKAEVTRHARQGGWEDGALWHRNYYESVIRDRRHLDAVRRYIANNPRAWESTHRSPRA